MGTTSFDDFIARVGSDPEVRNRFDALTTIGEVIDFVRSLGFDPEDGEIATGLGLEVPLDESDLETTAAGWHHGIDTSFAPTYHQTWSPPRYHHYFDPLT